VIINNKTIKLLLVDDDEDYFILAREILKEIDNTNYVLEWAETYEDAIKMIQMNKYDAYLFDYNLGQRSGIDLLEDTVIIDSKTPVIMLTGKGDIDIDTQAMRAGATDYLNKRHLKPELLERSIRYAIQNKGLLNERDILLQEINHRVKNNFQLISSIMQLEAGNINDREAQEVLDDCRGRLNTIALLHEKLYIANNAMALDAGDYIEGIVADLFRSYVTSTRKIEYSFKSNDVEISIKQLIHIGIIVNELVSNALKHAFNQDTEEKPHISVSLQEVEGIVHIRVIDNGIGIPASLDIRHTQSMGLNLVTILAEEQLEGELNVLREKGTTFHITFNLR
jgi:two-component sensor histidine kinase